MISIIVAIDNHYGIGKDNQLLCHLPNDLKRFKALTTGNTVIMGRNTFESLPKGPLPNRENIVLTTHPSQLPEGCIAASNLDEAIALSHSENIFIIGGASVYKQCMPLADRLLVTHIKQDFEGVDTYFPVISKEEWTPIDTEQHTADEKHPYEYEFITFVR